MVNTQDFDSCSGGSNPSSPSVLEAKVVEASDCGSEDSEFESHLTPKIIKEVII